MITTELANIPKVKWLKLLIPEVKMHFRLLIVDQKQYFFIFVSARSILFVTLYYLLIVLDNLNLELIANLSNGVFISIKCFDVINKIKEREALPWWKKFSEFLKNFVCQKFLSISRKFPKIISEFLHFLRHRWENGRFIRSSHFLVLLNPL